LNEEFGESKFHDLPASGGDYRYWFTQGNVYFASKTQYSQDNTMKQVTFEELQTDLSKLLKLIISPEPQFPLTSTSGLVFLGYYEGTKMIYSQVIPEWKEVSEGDLYILAGIITGYFELLGGDYETVLNSLNSPDVISVRDELLGDLKRLKGEMKGAQRKLG